MPPIRPRPPTGSPDQISVAVITGSDSVKAAVLDLSVATAGMGVNDGMAMLRLLGPGLRLQRDHIAPNYLRQRHRID